MTKFEFLMMIASVVIAIGMTEIVGGWGRLARTPAEISFDWLHFCWTLYILLSSIQYWIGMWSYAGAPFEYTFQIYFLVVPTLFLVFSAFAITPDVPQSGELNVREYYWARRFLPLAGFMVLAGLADLVIVGSKAVGAQAFIALPLAALFVLPALTSRVWVHAVALTLLGLFLVLFLLGEVSALDFDQRWPR
jgi:hypothetical protein